MADRLDTQLIVEAIAKGFKDLSGDLEKLGKDFKEVEKGIDSTSKKASQQKGVLDKLKDNWQLIVGGWIAAKKAIEGVKQAWDFTKEGAQIAKVKDTFDSLTASIGETSSTVLKDLKKATEGMVSDTELMASANRFLSMGLAETGSQASELARVAVTLGSAMGKDATQAMEEFSLLLANQSIPRLDTFGISAGKVRTRIKELQDANEDMSRETAFMTAVMEEAEISMNRLGDEVPVDSFTQFEINIQNVKDNLKILAAEGLGPVIGEMAELSSIALSNAQMMEEIDKAVRLGIISQSDFENAIRNAENSIDGETKALLALIEAIEAERKAQVERGNAVAGADAHLSNYIRTIEEYEGWIDLAKTQGDKYQETLEKNRTAFQRTNRELQRGKDAWEKQKEAVENATEAFRNALEPFDQLVNKGISLFNEELDELEPNLSGATLNQDALTRALWESVNAADMLNVSEETAIQRKIALGIALGQLNEQQAEAILKQWEMERALRIVEQAYEDGTIEADEARDMLIELGEAGSGALSDIVGWADRAKARLDALPTKKTFTYTVKTVYEGGRAVDVGAVSGGGTSGYRQHGGYIMGGQNILVGEAGPELLRLPAGTMGQVINNRQMSNVFNNTFTGDEGRMRMLIRQELASAGIRSNAMSRTL